jgi:hypothetical protein
MFYFCSLVENSDFTDSDPPRRLRCRRVIVIVVVVVAEASTSASRCAPPFVDCYSALSHPFVCWLSPLASGRPTPPLSHTSTSRCVPPLILHSLLSCLVFALRCPKPRPLDHLAVTPSRPYRCDPRASFWLVVASAIMAAIPLSSSTSSFSLWLLVACLAPRPHLSYRAFTSLSRLLSLVVMSRCTIAIAATVTHWVATKIRLECRPPKFRIYLCQI